MGSPARLRLPDVHEERLRMWRRKVGVGLVAAAALMLFAASASAATERLRLDFRSGGGGFAGPVSTQGSLTGATFSVAIVRGTLGAFSPVVWNRPGQARCGTPDARAMFPSPGHRRVPAMLDAETVWALPVVGGCGNLTLPAHQPGFEIDTGAGFSHREPIGGAQTAPAGDHRYRYVLTGAGAPAAFRFQDDYLGDNGGRLRITVRDARPSDCGQGGWLNFGVYASARECRALIPDIPA
jgi:hypothetical protein